jgi:hypothetical protein
MHRLVSMVEESRPQPIRGYLSLLDRFWWAIPVTLLVLVHGWGLTSWFMQDDFAWLGLRRTIRSAADLPRTFFLPMAQGTVRTISERLYFVGLFELFGMRAIPFRIVAFAVASGAIFFIGKLTFRLSGSRLAAILAGCFWVVNYGMPTPMAWSSALNQVLISLFLSMALYLFIRFCDTDKRKYLIGQWLVFLLGFGVLEVNVVYPAIASAYAWFCCRKRLFSALAMFPVAIAYAFIHRSHSAAMAPEIYKLYFDSELPKTFLTYGHWATRAARADLGALFPEPLLVGLSITVRLALLAFLAVQLRKRNYAALLGPLWFLAAIGPMIPIKLHISDYYLVTPSVGLAIWAGWAVASGLKSGTWKVPTLLCTALFAVLAVYSQFAATRFQAQQSHRVKFMVRSVAHALNLHPKKTILLDGVDASMFYRGILDHPFYALGITRVYLTQESYQKVLASPEGVLQSDVVGYHQAAATTYQGLADHTIEVYDVTSVPIRNVTRSYSRKWLSKPKPGAPEILFVGQKLAEPYLGSGWLNAEETHRWMQKVGVLKLAGPSSSAAKLRLTAIVPDFLVKDEPATLNIFINNELAGTAKLRKMTWELQESFAVPQSAVGKAEVEVRLELDRTSHAPGDTRDLGIAVNRISLGI